MTEREPPVYQLYGLRVRSDVQLAAPVIGGSATDLDVRWGRDLAGGDRQAEGRTIASLALENGQGYDLIRSHAGWSLRFSGICEFRFDAPLHRASVHLLPGAKWSLVPLLLTGKVAALVLALTGRRILHASAVEVDGSAYGFLGASGMGKSTLAALCCSSGARLIADDVLRVEPADLRFLCVRGPAEVRLREGGATLADRFPEKATRVTADRRLGLRVPGAPTDDLALRLIAIPVPSRGCAAVGIGRLSRAEALYSLTGYARVVGWRAPEIIAEQFARFGEIAEAVPVYRMTVPWGPPFAPIRSAAICWIS